MFSFLNLSFDFTEGNSSSRSVSKADPNKPWIWESNSPMTSTATLTPRSEPFFTPPPAKKPLESPEARAAEICPAQGVKKRQSVRHKQRRSSVFFKLPDLDKVLKGDKKPPPRGEGADGKKTEDGSNGLNFASRFGRAGGSSRRRSRRASVAPGGCSPGRTRADRAAAAAATEAAAAAAAEAAVAAQRDENKAVRSRDLDFPPLPIGAAAAAAAAAAGESVSCYDSKPNRRGTLLVTVGEDGPAPEEGADAAVHRQDHQEEKLQRRPSPRSSPRALSAGHRRESCRDSRVINRAPKGLSAARLLDDAQDVARIRQQANLRAKMEGVCWVASNWCVGGRKGVLSGKRFLVLCDNIVWAELREADRRCSLGEGGASNAGFMPIIALEGATVQHHEVATSNNGWVIEVVNPAEDVTLWLDPANPTALLRWGSVLCQALQQTMEDDE